MFRKRKDSSVFQMSNHDDYVLVDKNKMIKLTKAAKLWEFTCSFCFKKFPSAQALGGHQNAHRKERLKEKKLFVRDPIGYRRRAFLRAMKADESSGPKGGSDLSLDLHAASNMVKHELANINYPQAFPKSFPLLGEHQESSAFAFGNVNFHGHSCDNGENMKKLPFVLRNFLPPKGLTGTESVGMLAEDVMGQACIEFDVGCSGTNLEKLDLTLKL